MSRPLLVIGALLLLGGANLTTHAIGAVALGMGAYIGRRQP